jgi:hypothetical protein
VIAQFGQGEQRIEIRAIRRQQESR